MSRRLRILRNVGIGLAVFLVVAVVSTIVIVQTDWFRNFVRQKIIAATEEGTGGRVDIGSFTLDWRHLRAVVTDFVIHGKEPAGAAPFVRAARAQVDLKLFTGMRRLLDVSYLGVDRLSASILVFPDGTTNVPEPKTKKQSDTTALETIVDLAVGRFELTNGSVAFNSRKQPLDVKANNLRVQLFYNLLKQGYTGQLAMQPVYVVSGQNTPVVFTVTVPVIL